MKYKQASIFGITSKDDLSSKAYKISEMRYRRRKKPEEIYVLVTRIPDGTDKYTRACILRQIGYDEGNQKEQNGTKLLP